VNSANIGSFFSTAALFAFAKSCPQAPSPATANEQINTAITKLLITALTFMFNPP
jgi:hypothetical protein